MSDEPERAKSVFLAALGHATPEARAAFLAGACGVDAVLRRRVEELLAAHERLAAPPVRPAASETASVAASPGTGTFGDSARTEDHFPEPATGIVIAGKYKLMEEIGEGGMGSVWMAQQTEPVKRFVAVKLIKAGMDSKAVLARFEAERQALALMDHPNIARVLDAGATADGRPYFVMELVKGVPITKFCDERKLTPRQRLELFVPVCQAIQHAHQKGVIHRDIKPNNVLVALYDDRPVPKVIDFGVAKATGQALTDHTLTTGFGVVVGTPEYMSPEQASINNLDIDTRSDVYALGVLLYELLAGSPPFARKELEKAGLLEILRVVREVEPPKPSTKLSTADALPTLSANRGTEPKRLTALLRGELDWIVMKALEKDRTRRYETANGFAADVLRYLSGEPVQAVPPSAGYRFRKFLRRNRVPVTAGFLVLTALLAGIVGTTLGLFEARSAQRLADAEATNARTQEGIAKEKAAEAATQAGIAKINAGAATKQEGIAKDKAALAEQRAKELAEEVSKTRRARDNALFILARQDFDNHNVPLARDRLNEIDPANRGWEWNYLRRKMSGGLFTLYGHSGQVRSVGYSPDGRRILTGSADKTVRIWDARTGEHLLTFATGHVYCAAFNQDGTRIVTGSHDKIARLWDARTGELVREFKGHMGAVWDIAISPDGSSMLTGGLDNAVRVWDVRTGQSLFEVKNHQGRSGVAFSPDSMRIATGISYGTTSVFDAKSGQLLLTLGSSGTNGVAFSPDGSRIVTGSMSGTSTVWDAREGTKLIELHGRSGMVMSVAYSPDGGRIVTACSDSTARLWDAKSGRQLLELKGHSHYVLAAAFSPDGGRIVTGSIDNTAKVWDARTGGPMVQLIGHKLSVPSVAISPNNDWVVTGGTDKTVRIWDLHTGRQLRMLEGHTGQIDCVVVSQDGSRIVSGGWDRTARVWDVRTGATLCELPGHMTLASLVWISSDNSRVVTYENAAMARLWNAETGEKLLELKVPSRNVCVAFDPKTRRTTIASLVVEEEGIHLRDAVSGQIIPELRGFTSISPNAAIHIETGRIVTAALRDLSLWDSRTGKPLLRFKGPTRLVMNVAFTADGERVVASSDEGVVWWWDARTGQTLLEIAADVRAKGLAISPDGTRLVAGTLSRSPTVWDARQLAAPLELRGHTQQIKFAAFTPDGLQLATGSFDNTLRLWDVKTGKSALVLKGHTGGVYCIAFTPDGNRILTGSADGTARLWDARTGESLVEFKRPKTAPSEIKDIIESVAISPDGGSIVSGEFFSKSAWVWDVKTGKTVHQLKGHTSSVDRVAWSADGATIRTISSSANERFFWSAQTGERIPEPKATFPEPSEFSPDGKLFAHNCSEYVQLIPTALSDEVRADRLWWTRVRPDLLATAFDAAVRVKDEFAALQLLNSYMAFVPSYRVEGFEHRTKTFPARIDLIARTRLHTPPSDSNSA